jgi:hypothetical protein
MALPFEVYKHDLMITDGMGKLCPPDRHWEAYSNYDHGVYTVPYPCPEAHTQSTSPPVDDFPFAYNPFENFTVFVDLEDVGSILRESMMLLTVPLTYDEHGSNYMLQWHVGATNSVYVYFFSDGEEVFLGSLPWALTDDDSPREGRYNVQRLRAWAIHKLDLHTVPTIPMEY